MDAPGFLEEDIHGLDDGLQLYTNTLSASLTCCSATDGVLLHPSTTGNADFVGTGVLQPQVSGKYPYPADFLDGVQAMAPEKLELNATGTSNYKMNPCTVLAPVPFFGAVDPGLLAAEHSEESSISRMPSLTTTDSSGSSTNHIRTFRRPSNKFSWSRSSESVSFGAADSPGKKRTLSKTAASVAPKTPKSRKTSPAADGDDDSKRNTVLERNRVAALKCRKKKKEFVQDLEDQCVDLETTNHALQTEVQELLNELNSVKNHLMDHASCKDPRIDNWLESEAQRFVRESKERAMRERGGIGYGLTYENLIDSVAPTTATVSSNRSSLSESMPATSARRSRQGSACSSQTVGIPVRSQSSHSMSEGIWNVPMELPAYVIGSAHTSPAVPPYSTLKSLADEEG